MKKILCLAGYLVLLICLAGCASLKSVMHPAAGSGKTASVAALPPYSGPKAKITVADFVVLTAKAAGTTGSSLREMLVSTLIKSGRFTVVERQASGADLIVKATVSEFEPQASGGRAGVGGGGGVGSGRLGGLLGASLNKAHMSLDIRLVNAATSETLAASLVKGQAPDIEKAIQICIIEAVRYISKTIPETYYKD